MDELARLTEQATQAEREWWWLSGALHGVAQLRGGDPHVYLELVEQKRSIDRRRVELACRIAGLKEPVAGPRA